MVFWSKECPVTNLVMDCDIITQTTIQDYQWLREVCSTQLLATKIMLGGTGQIVQTDETQFRHKPMVSTR